MNKIIQTNVVFNFILGSFGTQLALVVREQDIGHQGPGFNAPKSPNTFTYVEMQWSTGLEPPKQWGFRSTYLAKYASEAEEVYIKPSPT